MSFQNKKTKKTRFNLTQPAMCAIYARYSSLNQKQASIDDQVRKCREAALAKGWLVSEKHIYWDEAKSGQSSAHREGFRTLLKTALTEPCPFQKILVDETSRIARNTREALDVFSLLSFYNIHVFFVSQGIDTSSETAEELITINGLVDSLYIRNLAHETHRAIEGKVMKGFSGGGKRYGYYSEPVLNGQVDIYGNPLAEGYLLKINIEEAETIRRIFRLYGEEGLSAIKIVNILNTEINRQGRPLPPRGKYWSISTILGGKKNFRGILNNELYIGIYRWNRSTIRRNPQTGSRRIIYKPTEKWIVLSKPDLRIVPDDLWQRVKRRQKEATDISLSRYVRGRETYSRNLLTGILKCRACNGNIVVVSGGKYAKYGCSNHWNKGEAVCQNDSQVGKDNLEQFIVNLLPSDLFDPSGTRYLTKKVNTLVRKALALDQQSMNYALIDHAMKKLNREIENYIRAISLGIVSKTIKNALFQAEERRNELINKAHKARQNVKWSGINEKEIINYSNNVLITLRSNPPVGRMLIKKALSNKNLTNTLKKYML